MSVAQAVLAVLGPIGTFLASIVLLLVRRHLRFLDRLDERLAGYFDQNAKVQAEIALELRLSREAREMNDAKLEDLVGEVETALGRKIDDRRMSELTKVVEELKQRTGSSPALDALPVVEADGDDEPTIAAAAPKRTATGRSRAVTEERVEPRAGSRPVLRSRPG